jgi:hypothetical protein
MRIKSMQSSTTLRGHSFIELAVLSAICGLAALASALGGTVIQLDLGNNALASNGAGFTKVGTTTANISVHNGSYYEYDNVAGSGYTLSFTNVDEWGGQGRWTQTAP